MFRGFADNIYPAFAPDYFAVFANFLHASSYFHIEIIIINDT